MNRIKIAHEAPLSLMKDVREVTDYDYCLVHKLPESKEYFKFFVESLEMGREVILDNSIFELGESFDMEEYAKWIEKLNPTRYIIPDVLEDSVATMKRADEWFMGPGKNLKTDADPMGVVQGKNFKEIVDCYRFMDQVLDLEYIAISFDYSYYKKTVPNSNKHISWMLGRIKLLGDLVYNKVINESKEHHLLGAALPQEFSCYQHYPWITSVDTSNPVVHAINGIGYHSFGLLDKESIKMVDLFKIRKKDVSMELLASNIKKFRNFTHGK